MNPQKICKFCGKRCFTEATNYRYDKSEIIATCPKGKAYDAASELIAQIEYDNKKKQNGGYWIFGFGDPEKDDEDGDSPKPPFPPGWGE